jgi:hypothetical protein
MHDELNGQGMPPSKAFSASLAPVTISGKITFGSSPAANVTLGLSGGKTGTATTDADGNYSFTMDYGGSVKITPVKDGYYFNPLYTSLDNITENRTANFTMFAYLTISGVITENNNPLQNVVVYLSGGAESSTVTARDGSYSIFVKPGLSYTVTPYSPGYFFTPEKKDFSNMTTNQVQNFSGARAVALKGAVTLNGNPLQGIVIRYAGTSSGTILTGTDGSYSVNLQYGGNYSITPEKQGYIFDPANISLTNVTSDKTQNFTARTDSITISGFIRSNNLLLGDASVVLSGSASKTITTGADGAYSFKVACFGNYTVTVSKQYYTFQPASKTFNNVLTNQIQDFQSTLNNITISGTITSNNNPLANASVYLSGSASQTALTSSSGKYSFSVPVLGNYTIRPEKSLYTFTPASTSFNGVLENKTADFTAKYLDSVNISGIVKLSDGTPVKGVNLKLTGASNQQVLSSDSGKYSFKVPTLGTYYITPSLPCYTFNPAQRTYENLSSEQSGQNFYASCDTIIISGTILLSDNKPMVNTKIFEYGGKSVNTDTAGNYSLKVLSGLTINIIPYVAGYSMDPQSYTFPSIKSNKTANFKATKASITLLYPDATKKTEPNDTIEIKWNYTGIDSGKVTLRLFDRVQKASVTIAERVDIRTKKFLWNLKPGTNATTSAAVVIQLEPNQAVFDTSDNFRIYPPRKINSFQALKVDSIEYGKISTFTWQTEGNIDSLLFMIAEGGGMWNYVKRIHNTGKYDWKVDIIPANPTNSRYSVKLVDKNNSNIASALVSFSIIINPVITLSAPANDPSGSIPVSVKPVFSWNMSSNYSTQTAEKIYWSIKISADSTMRGLIRYDDTILTEERINVNGTRSYSFPLELNIGTKYYWKIYAYYYLIGTRRVDLESKVFSFKTENTVPDIPVLVAPSTGYILDEKEDKTLKFVWKRPSRATGYKIQFASDSNFTADVIEKNVSPDTTFTQTIAFQAGKNAYWRVKATNLVGDGKYSAANKIIMLSSCQTIAGFNICAYSWDVNPDGSYKGTNPSMKVTGKTNGITIQKGWIRINKDKTKIDSIYGEVYFPLGNSTFPTFKGFFTINGSSASSDPLCAIPSSTVENLVRNTTLFGKLPLNTLKFTKIDLNNSLLYFKYDKMTVDVPGVRVVDTRTERVGDTVHFHTSQPWVMDNQGNISGKVDNYMIQAASVLLIVRNVNASGTAADRVTFVSSDYSINYNRLNNSDNDYQGTSTLTIGSDHTIEFLNDFVSFPDLTMDIAGMLTNTTFPLGFTLPQVSYRKDELSGKYVMDIYADVTLPFCFSKSSSSGSGKGTSSTEVGTGAENGGCTISGSATLISTPPYFQGFSFAAANCWEIEIAPFIFWTGLSGNMSFFANDAGRINNFGIGGSVDLQLSIPPTLISGTNGFDFDSRGYLKLYGVSYLFQRWKLAESMLKFDWSKRDGLAISASYDLYWLAGIVHGHLAGGIEVSKNSFKQGIPNMFFDGMVEITIPKHIVSIGKIKLPKKDRHLASVGAQVGRFKHDGESKGFGFQAWMSILDLFDLSAYIPLETGNSFHFGLNKYELITFARSMAQRRKGKENSITGVPKYQLGATADTLRMDVPYSPANKICFVVGSNAANPPDVTAFDPNNLKYESKTLLAENEELIADSGYIMPVTPVKGSWKLIVDKIAPGSDYTINVIAGNVKPTITIDDVQKVNDTQYKIKYTAKDPDGEDDISFYLMEDTAATGKMINTDPVKENDKSGEYTFDPSTFKNGNYKIYALINDGSGPYVKSNYSSVIKIENNSKPSKVANLKIYRLSNNNVKLNWDENLSANSYNIYSGKKSGIYTDTVLSLYQPGYFFLKLTDTTNIYATVAAVNINGIAGSQSDEIKISLASAVSDSIPPAAPDAPVLSAVLNSLPTDTAKEYISVSWNPIADASGYTVYYTDKGSSKLARMDAQTKTSVNLESLTKGITYVVKIKAYDASGNISGYSPESEINFFSSLDTDNDGMPDEWEKKYFSAIDVTDKIDEDTDGDGLSNKEELAMGTNPNNPDTDNDGVWDDVDPHPLSNMDNNGNGIADDYESYYEISDPSDDPDKDGLTNLQEYQNRTNPKNPDTDGGGLSDGEEIAKGLNPLSANDDKWTKGFMKLQSFTGKLWRNTKTMKDTLVLQWSTSKEQDATGFRIYRKSDKDQYYTAINDDLISVTKDTVFPHSYTYKDGKIESGTGYSYYITGVSKYGNTDSLGVYYSSTFTKVDEVSQVKPEKFELFQNYPNPFNPSTKIQFAIPSDSYVILKVYDMLGREVATLVDKSMKAGVYSVNFESRSLSSGQYLYRLRCGNNIQTKSMLLLR